MSAAAETSALLTLLIRAMVSDRDAVKVKAIPTRPGTTVFQVIVAKGDVGKLIGKQGRLARSLRIVLHAIGHEQNETYMLDVPGDGQTPSTAL